MAYEKQNWENLPNETTPISAERLSHMETQYDESVAYTDTAITNLDIPTISEILDRPVLGENLIGNGNFEEGVGAVAAFAGVSRLSRGTNPFGVALGDYHLTVTGAASGITLANAAIGFRKNSTPGIVRGLVETRDAPFFAITFSARTPLSTPLGVFVVGYFYNAEGTYLGARNATETKSLLSTGYNSSESARRSYSFPNWVGATYVLPQLRFYASDLTSPPPPGFIVHIDRVKFSSASSASEAITLSQDYFDGSFPPAGDYTASWTGEIGSSPSVYRERIMQDNMVVQHGTVSSTPRPDGASLVTWVGSGIPTNARSNDLWITEF